MAIGKWAKRKSAQATKAVGKRYGVSYGRRGVRFSKNSMSKIAKDVMMIKSQLNVEKKYVDNVELENVNVGQVSQNSPGYVATFTSPVIPQGTGESERVGNSVKMTGAVFKMNFIKQSNGVGPRRLKVMIIRSLDPGLLPSAVADRLLDVNPLTGVRDFHSNLDYTQLKDGRLKIIASKNVYLGANSTESEEVQERATAVKTIALKMNEVTRFENDAGTISENVRYITLILCDNGNASATTSTILGVYVPTPNSGVICKLHSRFWYVDN